MSNLPQARDVFEIGLPDAAPADKPQFDLTGQRIGGAVPLPPRPTFPTRETNPSGRPPPATTDQPRGLLAPPDARFDTMGNRIRPGVEPMQGLYDQPEEFRPEFEARVADMTEAAPLTPEVFRRVVENRYPRLVVETVKKWIEKNCRDNEAIIRVSILWDIISEAMGCRPHEVHDRGWDHVYELFRDWGWQVDLIDLQHGAKSLLENNKAVRFRVPSGR